MTLSNTHTSTPSYFISELEKHLPCLKAGKEVNPQPLRPPTKEKPFQKKKNLKKEVSVTVHVIANGWHRVTVQLSFPVVLLVCVSAFTRVEKIIH